MSTLWHARVPLYRSQLLRRPLLCDFSQFWYDEKGSSLPWSMRIRLHTQEHPENWCIHLQKHGRTTSTWTTAILVAILYRHLCGHERLPCRSWFYLTYMQVHEMPPATEWVRLRVVRFCHRLTFSPSRPPECRRRILAEKHLKSATFTVWCALCQ